MKHVMRASLVMGLALVAMNGYYRTDLFGRSLSRPNAAATVHERLVPEYTSAGPTRGDGHSRFRGRYVRRERGRGNDLRGRLGRHGVCLALSSRAQAPLQHRGVADRSEENRLLPVGGDRLRHSHSRRVRDPAGPPDYRSPYLRGYGAGDGFWQTLRGTRERGADHSTTASPTTS